MSVFYARASLVLNLTNPRLAIETFGLTPLEAMAAGLPVIVPPVGGIAELVQAGVNGYCIDVACVDAIASHINTVLGDAALYRRLSAAALRLSQRYDSATATASIAALL